MGTYTVTIGFAGFIGVENQYEVDAENEEAAKEEALQMAMDDLDVLDVSTDSWDE